MVDLISDRSILLTSARRKVTILHLLMVLYGRTYLAVRGGPAVTPLPHSHIQMYSIAFIRASFYSTFFLK